MPRIPMYLALVMLACGGSPPAAAIESWNSACLAPLRQAKEDWIRLSTQKARDAAAREIRAAEQLYRLGRDAECKARVERAREAMK